MSGARIKSRWTLELASAWRHAAIADGWECRPTYVGHESDETHATLSRDGWSAHVMARPAGHTKWQTRATADVTVWGPDGLVVPAPLVYSMTALEAGVRVCPACGATDVPTSRVGFAGRACQACLPAQRKLHEFPGWCD